MENEEKIEQELNEQNTTDSLQEKKESKETTE